jgi:hypothetical protein
MSAVSIAGAPTAAPASSAPAEVDIYTFKLRAVVDWVEVEFETSKPTNGWTVQAHCEGFKFVQPQNDGAGGAATVFRARIQDPKNFQAVYLLVEKLKHKFSLIAEPRVVGREIALDAYKPGATRRELAAMVAHMFKFHTKPASENRRFQGLKGTKGFCEGPFNFPNMKSRFEEGRTLFIADVGSEEAGRFYVKTTDAGHDLPEATWRSRMELITRHRGASAKEIDSLREYRFESLMPAFTFRKAKGGLDAFRQRSFDRSCQVGEKKLRHYLVRRGSKTELPTPSTTPSLFRAVKFHSGTAVDRDLNAKVRDALRELSRRWAAEDWRISHPRRSEEKSEKKSSNSVGALPDCTARPNNFRFNVGDRREHNETDGSEVEDNIYDQKHQDQHQHRQLDQDDDDHDQELHQHRDVGQDLDDDRRECLGLDRDQDHVHIRNKPLTGSMSGKDLVIPTNAYTQANFFDGGDHYRRVSRFRRSPAEVPSFGRLIWALALAAWLAGRAIVMTWVKPTPERPDHEKASQPRIARRNATSPTPFEPLGKAYLAESRTCYQAQGHWDENDRGARIARRNSCAMVPSYCTTKAEKLLQKT